MSKVWMIQVLKHGAQPSTDLAKRIARLSEGRIAWTEFFPAEAA